MKTVKQLLNANGAHFVSIAPDATLIDALALMNEKDSECLLVMEGDRLAGIMTETDYTRKVALSRGPQPELVKDVMTRQVITVTPDQRSEECIDLMLSHNIHHLPVMDGPRVVGLISLNDAVQSTLFHQRDTIRFLEDMMLMDVESA